MPWIFEYRLTRIETQLADTIDVVVASLSSGSSLQASLIEAADFSQQPLKTVPSRDGRPIETW